MDFSEKKYVNNMAVKGHTVINFVLFAAYFLEVLKGSRTIGYFAVFALLTVVPVAAEWLVCARNPQSGIIKYIIGITYGMLYFFVIFEVTRQMTGLGDSVVKVHGAMQEVSDGSTETAESVQVQIQRTEQIQEHISSVKNTAVRIGQNVHDTVNRVAAGREQMTALEIQIRQSESANADVLEKMQELSTYTGQMNTITETISSITNSTVMLALNASIEAARAGEAGKGHAGETFSVCDENMCMVDSVRGIVANLNDGAKKLQSV